MKLTKRTVVVLLVLFGPFALPFLWMSAAFTTQTKWIWTIMCFAVTTAMYLVAAPLVGTLVSGLDLKSYGL